MGRVARFKKVRACDPYSRENRGRLVLDRVGVWGLGDSGRKAKKRSLVAQKYQTMKRKRRKDNARSDDGFDLPPNEEDEFDSNTLQVQKKTKPLSMEDVAKTKQSEREIKKEESRINKLLKIDAQVEPKKGPVAVPEKMPGESKNAYRKRVKAEVSMIIREEKKQSTRNPAKKEKKKEFLKNKKLKKKGGAAAAHQYNSTDPSGYNESDDDLVTAERAVQARHAAPKFGEQAERPPEFKLLPRGATKKSDEGRPSSKKRKAMADEDVLAEQEAMELMRRKVQAQYALVRQKRRRQFHL